MILIVADDLLRKFEFHIPATNGDRLSYCINMYCSIMTTQITHYSSQLTAAIVVVSATHQQLMAAISAITSWAKNNQRLKVLYLEETLKLSAVDMY